MEESTRIGRVHFQIWKVARVKREIYFEYREEACKWRVCIRYLQNFVKGEKRKKKKKERRKEEERQGGTELISVFFCWAVSWTRPLEQGEEGKDSWREGETRRRGKRASSLRMSLLSPRLVHNLLLQSRVESRRRIFSGAPFLSFGFSQSTTTSNPRKRRATNPWEKVHSNFSFIINQNRANFLTVREAFVQRDDIEIFTRHWKSWSFEYFSHFFDI